MSERRAVFITYGDGEAFNEVAARRGWGPLTEAPHESARKRVVRRDRLETPVMDVDIEEIEYEVD